MSATAGAIEAYARKLFAQVDERHGDTWDGATEARRTVVRRLARESLEATAGTSWGDDLSAWLSEQIAVCDAWVVVGDRDIPERGERYWRGQADAFREVRERIGGDS